MAVIPNKASLAERLKSDNLSEVDKRGLIEIINNLDESQLREAGIDEAEKRSLLRKLRPTPAEWQKDLKNAYIELKNAALDAKRRKGFLGPSDSSIYSTPYRFSHESLVTSAKTHRPKKTGTRVTDFSDWVYSLYHANKNEERMAHGKRIEQERIRQVIPAPANDSWELRYEGIRTTGISKVISTLTVNGQPLKGKPDFVFREKSSGAIVIVEIKASDKEIPSDGWPNLKAQLWAYAHIDEWLNAPTVLLVGEIWWYSKIGKISLRGRRRWEHNDEEFNKRNLELFNLYRDTAREPIDYSP